MIKALIKLIEGPDYDLGEWDEVKAQTPIVGADKPVKIKAKTSMIPARKASQELRNLVSMFIPIVPSWLLELEDETSYILGKSQTELIVADEDVDDWNYLLDRFNKLLGNFIKVLDNIRRVDYHKIISDKLLEREIQNRKIKITEKLLEKVEEKKEEPDEKSKIDALTAAVTGLVAAGALGAAATQAAQYDPNMPPAGADFVQVAEYLQKKYDLEPHQAAAIVGVWMNEGMGKGRPDDIEDAYAAQYGDFGPPPIGSTRVGYGWAQWTNMAPGGRLDRVADAIGVTDRAWTNQDNLRAFDWELPRLFPNMMDQLRETSTVDEATTVFTTVYEAGGNLQPYFNMHGPDFLNRRINSASSVLNGMIKNKAMGAIVIPQLLDTPIIYNMPNKNIGDLIIDKPTIINVDKVGEPIIVIPTERPIGREVLNILFREPFRKIDQIYQRKQQEATAQTPIQNNTTSINRTTIPTSPPQESSSDVSSSSSYTTSSKSQTVSSTSSIAEEFADVFVDLMGKRKQLPTAPLETYATTIKSNIDTVSQKTENVFGPKVILITQDIYATEE